MSIDDILHSGANVSITICANDLLQFANHLVKTTMDGMEAEVTAKREEVYKSPSETSELLHVDKSTLWRWAKIGYLIPIEVGGKRLYKKSDIDAILQKN